MVNIEELQRDRITVNIKKMGEEIGKATIETRADKKVKCFIDEDLSVHFMVDT